MRTPRMDANLTFLRHPNSLIRVSSTTMATVSPAAAAWIVQYLHNANAGRVSDDAIRRLTVGNGLNALIGECIVSTRKLQSF